MKIAEKAFFSSFSYSATDWYAKDDNFFTPDFFSL